MREVRCWGSRAARLCDPEPGEHSGHILLGSWDSCDLHVPVGQRRSHRVVFYGSKSPSPRTLQDADV